MDSKAANAKFHTKNVRLKLVKLPAGTELKQSVNQAHVHIKNTHFGLSCFLLYFY
jgi:hypothetical protein